ncbi:DUF2513 domain-containing protein [Pukyongiella litopenaei]|uniref:DUF2513 domain-containing protein n=1 Tax=Pukyongiella litopenaei TaxID=2605946 RepID=UPI001FCE683D|nr:DUF2513 domain-containing protein [Pukyongiella litopenaei]
MLFEFEQQEDWSLLFVKTLSMDAIDRNRLGHIHLMCDAGLVAPVNNDAYRLTNTGHDYLAAIRSDTVWQRTKNGAAKVGGLTLGMMKDLAVAYVKQEANNRLGIQL